MVGRITSHDAYEEHCCAVTIPCGPVIIRCFVSDDESSGLDDFKRPAVSFYPSTVPGIEP